MDVSRAIREWNVWVAWGDVFDLKDSVLFVTIIIKTLQIIFRIINLWHFLDPFGWRKVLTDTSHSLQDFVVFIERS